MPSNLYALARQAWFEKHEVECVHPHPKKPPVTITYENMLEFGGPREYSKCEYCTVQEWYSRISGRNCYAVHECTDPAHHDLMKMRCGVVFTRGWRHLRRNYNFALTGNPALPGRKCLFVVAGHQRLLNHGAHPGFMIWRKRMSMYRTTLCSFDKIHTHNLNDYDFIVMTIHGGTPLIPQAGNPPIFLYGHDHHRPDLRARAQELLNHGPAGLLTPYPTIWSGAFKIHKNTRVIFAPYLSDPFWSEMNTDFQNREFDVMVIGTIGHMYPERHAIHTLLKAQTKLPFKLKLWAAPKPTPALEDVSALKYGAPPLAMWSKHLARAKICLFGQDKFGYLVNKYAEVPGACSLMVAPRIPECERVGLVAGKNYIALKRPVQQQLVPQLTQLVKQFNKGGKGIALQGLKWFQQRCSHWLYDQFWEEIETTLEGR